MSIYLGTSKYSGSAGIAGGDASVIASNLILSTTAQTYITVNNQGKTLQLASTPPVSWLGSTSSTAAAGNHAHGHITSAGAVTQSGVDIGTGDSLLFVDSSNSSLIRKSSVTFPGNALVFLDGTGSFSSAPITSVSYTPTVTSSTSGAYVMGTLTINGSDTTLYGKDTTSSGGGGASYLGDLNDVSTTGASSGQALVYNGSSWAPGTVGGGGSWSPTQLSSGFRIWDLSDGIYIMPASGVFYYNGSANTTTATSTGGLLFVYTEGSYKQWFVFSDDAYNSASSYPANKIMSGYTNSTSGSYTSKYFSTTNGSSMSIGSGGLDSSNLSNFNSTNRYLYDPGFNWCQIPTTVQNGPTNLSLSAVTYGIIIVSKNQITQGHAGDMSRQDLIIPSLGRHWYRYVTYSTSALTPLTTTLNCDTNGWVEVLDIPRYTSSDANKYLRVATGGASLQWATVSGSSGAINPEFAEVSAEYSSTYSVPGTSVYSGDAGDYRNFIKISIDSTDYSSYFSQDEKFGFILDNYDYNSGENYLMICNEGNADIEIDPDLMRIYDTSQQDLINGSTFLQSDSTGSSVKIAHGTWNMFGLTLLGGNIVVTYGGTFNEI